MTILGIKAYDRFLMNFVLPAAVVLLLFREPLRDYGFRWGNWKEGLAWTVAACAVMALILWVVARRPEIASYYKPKSADGFWRAVWKAGVDLFAWEFLWRGLTLFALARVAGPGTAIWLQAVPFSYAHLGKPEIETMSCIFGGAGFGFVAWKSQSFIYPFIIHVFITAWTIWVAMTFA